MEDKVRLKGLWPVRRDDLFAGFMFEVAAVFVANSLGHVSVPIAVANEVDAAMGNPRSKLKT